MTPPFKPGLTPPPMSIEDILRGLDPNMLNNLQLPPTQMGGIGQFIDQALQQHQQQQQDAQQAAFRAQGFMTTPLPAKPNKYEDDFGTHDPFRDYE